jgi:hypothetical protein
MDEMRRRRLSIARELATWGVAMPALLARISEAIKMLGLTGPEKLDFEVMVRMISTSFDAIGKTPDAEASDATNYEQLIERTNRLRELIARAKVALARVAKPV